MSADLLEKLHSWVPMKDGKPIQNADEFDDAELKKTPAWQVLVDEGSIGALYKAGALSEANLLTIVRKAVAGLLSQVSRNKARPAAKQFLAEMAKLGFKSEKGYKIVLDDKGEPIVKEIGGGKVGGRGRGKTSFSPEQYAKLIGRTRKVTVGERASKERRGDYTLEILAPLASRPDVPFSLKLTQPNGKVITYPAANKDNSKGVTEFAGEANALTDVIKKSMLGYGSTPALVFRLDKMLEALAEGKKPAEHAGEATEPKKGKKGKKSGKKDEESDESDESEGEGEMDLGALLSEESEDEDEEDEDEEGDEDEESEDDED